jgi:transcriptional regulator with XRE-family HTH domain
MKIVGVNIKRLREEKGISLRDLARRVGVTASFLSQVETAKTSPSLATLKKIADSLETTVGNLVGEDAPKNDNPVVTEKDRRTIREIGHDVKMYLLSTPNPNKQMEPLLFEMKANASSGETVYSHFGQEFVLVLKGAIEISLNDKEYILNKGDSIYFNSNTPHSFRNISKGTTEALWVVTPPTF